MPLAKLTRPASINPVLRARLFRLLDGAAKRPVTWVWAPPGAGKTTLIASYLSARRLQSLWYQVDEGDEDLATFFYYLGQAAPKRKRSLPLFTPEYQQGFKIFTRNFFRELYGRLKPPFVLVFDNYQEVSSEAQLHEAMRVALAEVPEGGRVIFISRSEPPAVYAELRAKQCIELLDWNEIKFTRAEVNELVGRLARGKWPKRAIDQLYETSDGWAAGLLLLIEQLSLSKDQEKGGPGTAKGSQLLFDYFAAEVFKTIDHNNREVLLVTSFLPTVTSNAAEVLTENNAAGTILAHLHRQNFFTNKRPGADPTYEYHPLLREFLQAEASRSLSAERQDGIRRKAAEIAQMAGQVEVAAQLYRDAEDWEALSKLICETAPVFVGQGRMKVVEEWIRAVPQGILHEKPWLLYWRGTAWQGWRHADCQRDLKKAFSLFQDAQNPAGMLLCSSALILSYQGEGFPTPMDPWICAIERILPAGPIGLDASLELQVTAGMLSALAVRIPHHPNGQPWAERAIELSRADCNVTLRAITAFNWVLYQAQIGLLVKAGSIVDEMRLLMRNPALSPVVRVNASLSVAYFEWLNAIPSYRSTVTETLEFAGLAGMYYAAKPAILTSGIVGAVTDGDTKLAEEWIEVLAKEIHSLGAGMNGLFQQCIVHLALVRNDIPGAAAHQPEMLRLGLEAGWPLQDAAVRLFSALVLNARGSREEARSHIDASLEIARTMRSPYVEFMARKIEAHICFDNGEEGKALDSLRIAMELGRRGGFVNSQVWIPSIMARLCAKALEHGIEPEYARMLVRKRHLVPEEPPVDIEGWPWPIKIYTLGRFLVFKDDQPLSFSHKVQRKPLALLKAIIAFGGKGVREDVLIDTLWG